MQFSNVAGVLFDLDGTLLDSAPDLGGAADQMRIDRGMPSLPMELYRSMAGAGARGMLGVAFGLDTDHPDYEKLKEEFFINYTQCLTRNTYAFIGVPELIVQLGLRGLPWGVVTNKASRFADPLTRSIPFFSTASAMVCGDTTAHAKPHPAPLLEACRRMRVDPRQCLYVGDDERDVVAGLAAGMGTVAATYGYLGKKAVQDWGAHAQIHAPLDLMQLISNT